jgi:hypothetical protein
VKKIRVYHFHIAYDADSTALEIALQDEFDWLDAQYHDTELVSVVQREVTDFETHFSAVYTYVTLKD